MRTRIPFDIIIFILAFIAPPWLAIIISVAGLFYFRNFYEIFAVGFIIDVIYGIPLSFLPVPALYTVFVGCLFIVSFFLKKYLSFYR